MEQPTEERYLMLYGLELIQGQRELRANLIALDEEGLLSAPRLIIASDESKPETGD